MVVNTDAREPILTLGLGVLWIALMTFAGWYGRGVEPVQYFKVSGQCPVERTQAPNIGR